MDDLLKRMLEVEKAADEIVVAADKDARRILAEARQAAAAEDARMVGVTNQAAEELSKSKIGAAERERDARLAEADSNIDVRAKEYTASIASKKQAIIAALAGGSCVK